MAVRVTIFRMPQAQQPLDLDGALKARQ